MVFNLKAALMANDAPNSFAQFENSELPEDNTHSFIVKVWLEETQDEDGKVVWRGDITHVQGGERRYLRNLNQLKDFIEAYLVKMGVRLSGLRRIKSWFRQE